MNFWVHSCKVVRLEKWTPSTKHIPLLPIFCTWFTRSSWCFPSRERWTNSHIVYGNIGSFCYKREPCQNFLSDSLPLRGKNKESVNKGILLLNHHKSHIEKTTKNPTWENPRKPHMEKPSKISHDSLPILFSNQHTCYVVVLADKFLPQRQFLIMDKFLR